MFEFIKNLLPKSKKKKNQEPPRRNTGHVPPKPMPRRMEIDDPDDDVIGAALDVVSDLLDLSVRSSNDKKSLTQDQGNTPDAAHSETFRTYGSESGRFGSARAGEPVESGNREHSNSGHSSSGHSGGGDYGSHHSHDSGHSCDSSPSSYD